MYMTQLKNTPLILITTALLGGCFASPEDLEARRSQFIGQDLDQVIATIGEPKTLSKTQAVWLYRQGFSNRVPIQSYINGSWVTTGYRTEQGERYCTFTTGLESRRIVSTNYEGNSCERYAPKL